MLKPGTKVRVKTEPELISAGYVKDYIGNLYKETSSFRQCWDVSMRKFSGQQHTVNFIYDREKSRYFLTGVDGYYFAEDMFVVAKPKRNLPAWF